MPDFTPYDRRTGNSAILANPYRVPRALGGKYDRPGPRYTSYPTVPNWTANFSANDAVLALREHHRLRSAHPLSLYVHIPFCAKLCYYCGCNIHLTRDDQLVERYLADLDWEIGEVASMMGQPCQVVQLHWGGGTPTHLSPAQIEKLFHTLTARFTLTPNSEISLEVHPNVTTYDQLLTLSQLGFNRISMGVQDFDPVVQKAVNRHQTFEQTRDLVQTARFHGFKSVNLDLMYGLPHQTLQGFDRTLEQVANILPERLALFNYAHLPEVFPHQKIMRALPSRDLKLDLFELAVERLCDTGYEYIGMDHFALPHDDLARSRKERTLRRNFMGYATCAQSELVAFGASAISGLDGAIYQNERKLEAYHAAIAAQRLPIFRGLNLSADDKLRRDIIDKLACHGFISMEDFDARYGIVFEERFKEELAALKDMETDGLITRNGRTLQVQPAGQVLIRNILMVFDAYLCRSPEAGQVFSRTV